MSSSGRLAAKRALVTGAASGLGRAIARSFAREGAEVIITDINESAGQATAEELGLRFMAQDVTDEAQWAALFTTIEDDSGPVDILVNNAGFADAGLGTLLEDIDLENTRKIFNVNFDGTLLGCKYAIRHMRQRGGSIVNMSSIAGLLPVPFIAGYGAAKAAVRHLTQSVALYCAQQGYPIRCNCIHPGQIRTPMHDRLVSATAAQHGITEQQAEAGFLTQIPTGEFGREEDVANAALYLASDESRHVTGDRMLVDGGMLLSN